MEASYRVPRDRAEPRALSDRLDRILEQRLPEHLARVLRLSDEDPSLWFIRRLELDARLEAALVEGADEGAATRQIVEAFTKRLTEVTSHGEQGDDVVRFEDRAHFYARYAEDSARGMADSRWYFGELDGLSALSRSSRIQAALLREPALTIPILRRLWADRAGAEVLRALTVAAGRKVLHAVKGSVEPAPLDDALLARLGSLWRKGPPVSARLDDPRQVLVIALDGDPGGESFPAWAAAVERVAGLFDRFVSTSEDGRSELISALASEQSAGLVGWLRRHAPERLAEAPWWSQTPKAALRAWLRSHSTETVLRSSGTKGGGAAEPSERWLTEYGFAFLLAAELAAFEVEAPALRWLCLVKAAGSSEQARARSDRTLLRLAGLDAPVREPDARAALTELERAVTRLRHFRHVRGRVVIEPATLQSRPVWVARDIADDVWVDADFDEGALLRRLDERAFSTLPSGAPELESFRARARPVSSDLEDLWSVTALDRTLEPVLLAHAVIRAFARRLIGFGWSHSEHLRRNLFPGACAAEVRGEAIDVELPAVPLQLVLRLAGFDRRRVALPWLGRELTLHLAGG